MKEDYSKKHPDLARRSWPDPNGKIILVTVGSRMMKIGYTEHIDSSVPRDKLKTIILLPGTPG